ncbi:hypothetical protein [Nonomuraea sp. NPDC048826]|uniref:hypothetical protein n=1 Tax=Nonomuraea sp. NPDC048826 TaxID=3364347 RepID=UPI0037149822
MLTKAQARTTKAPGYIVATLARWLGECSQEDYQRLVSAPTSAEVPQEVLDSIAAMYNAGLTEQAEALRRRFVPVDLERLADSVQKILGYDPLQDERGQALAASLSTYQRVLELDQLTLDRLKQQAATPARRDLYSTYPAVLSHAGYDPDRTCLLGDFPVTYLAVGYSRTGFSPAEADLVPHRGKVSRGSPMTTLLFAHPTTTEALLFALDEDRVRRWILANKLVHSSRVGNAADLRRWFVAHLNPADGQLPDFPADIKPSHPQWAARQLFGLLHTLAHQMLRALSVDSGYSETSLSEYLFPYELSFALHPNGHSEFSIGALRTVLEQNLDAVVNRALDNDTCLYDPHCMHATEGADHGCLLLPETACRCWNRYLSRWYLYGSPKRNIVGYWSPELQ